MKNIKETSLNELIAKAIKNNWNRMALSDMGGINYQFKDVALTIAKLHILFEAAGIRKGDKIAICGRNSSNWAVTFLACVTYGAVAVPLLHEFKPDTIHHLVVHSDAKLLFVDQAIWEDLDEKFPPALQAAIYISEFGMPYCTNPELEKTRANLNVCFGKKYPYEFSSKDVSYFEDKPDDICVINYTSGSTGMSKGVILPYRSIFSNIRFCIENLDFLQPGDGIVNMLPLAHLYGMVIEMLHPFVKGCHCNFLTKVPSPKIILNAFARIRPKLVITVPLILEKLIRSKVFPVIEKPMMKFLLKIPYLDDKLLAKIKTSLTEAFGGELRELIVGGAALNPEVAAFLERIQFPFTVGYGMTECGPLVSYDAPQTCHSGTVGKVVDRMEVRIDSPDPQNVLGNLWVKGDNVMKGYYKNDKATAEVMPHNDGWMNTGDLCTMDADGYLKISGRSKTMILGPSGQNIYPEEIEARLNNMPYVAESLVISEGDRLVALVYPDLELAHKEGLTTPDIEKIMNENLAAANNDLPGYSRISRIKLMAEEFEKTPKRSIKRFLYQP